MMAGEGFQRRASRSDSAIPISMIPTPPVSVLKERKKQSALGGNASWEWRAFTNSSRTDGLELRHWQRKGQPIEEYPFARFHKKVSILKYTDEEYTRHLAVPEWTKQETDMLMKLAVRFDLNFIVIQDRWPEGEGSAARTTEHLKDRFYAVQRKLAEARGLGADNEESVLLSQPYSIEWEQARKANMEKYFQRSKAEEKSDMLITEQARKIEAVQRKRKAEAKKRKSAEGDDEGAAGAPGGAMLRSMMLTRTPEKLNAVRWLQGTGLQLNVASQKIQDLFETLCSDVVDLIDWQKRVARKRKEREQLAMRRAELLRPLKKRKTAPSQRLQDGSALGVSPAAAPAAPGMGRLPPQQGRVAGQPPADTPAQKKMRKN